MHMWITNVAIGMVYAAAPESVVALRLALILQTVKDLWVPPRPLQAKLVLPRMLWLGLC